MELWLKENKRKDSYTWFNIIQKSDITTHKIIEVKDEIEKRNIQDEEGCNCLISRLSKLF